jgi:hypothetical protein
LHSFFSNISRATKLNSASVRPILHCQHVSITDGRILKSTKFEWPLVARLPRQVWRKFIDSLCYVPDSHLWILSLWGASCCVTYTWKSFRQYTRNCNCRFYCCCCYYYLTTCFGLHGPSSSEYNTLSCPFTSSENHCYCNGSAVLSMSLIV